MKHGWELVESDPLLRLLKPVFARVVFVLPVQQLSADVVFERFKYWKGTHYLGNGIFNQFSITIDTVIVLYLVWGNSYTMIMTNTMIKQKLFVNVTLNIKMYDLFILGYTYKRSEEEGTN